MRDIIYAEHPLGAEEKKSLSGKYKIIDLRFMPSDWKGKVHKKDVDKKATK